MTSPSIEDYCVQNFCIEEQGVVTEVLPNVKFRVKLSNGSEILCDPSRQMLKNYIPISVGNRVKVVLRSFDANEGCIILRFPKAENADSSR